MVLRRRKKIERNTKKNTEEDLGYMKVMPKKCTSKMLYTMIMKELLRAPLKWFQAPSQLILLLLEALYMK